MRGTRIAYIGDAVNAIIPNGFSGIVVDLFLKGSLSLSSRLRGRLRKGGRIIVNVGGSCVEVDNRLRNGKVVMEEIACFAGFNPNYSIDILSN